MMQKRISAPKTYSILRKDKVWTPRIRPGPHKRKESIPLGLLIRDFIHVARNVKEVKKVLKKKEVFVDGVARKDYRFPIGFMDVISIPKIKKYYRITYDIKGRMIPLEIKKKEAELKLVMIKKKIKKKKEFQIITHDGRTIIVKKIEGRQYKTGSSLLIKIPSQDIINYVPLEKNVNAFIIGGKHIGVKAKVKEVRELEAAREDLVVIKIKDREYETIKSYAFPLGGKETKVTI